MWHPCTDPGYWLPRAAGRWPTGCRAGGSSAGGDPPPWWRSGPHWPPPAPPPPPSPPQGETSWSHQCVATIYMLGLTILKTCRHDVKMLIIVWYSWIVMVVARSRLEWCWGQQNNGEESLTWHQQQAALHRTAVNSNGIHQTQRITQPQWGDLNRRKCFKSYSQHSQHWGLNHMACVKMWKKLLSHFQYK